jgi:hypothetical protein
MIIKQLKRIPLYTSVQTCCLLCIWYLCNEAFVCQNCNRFAMQKWGLKPTASFHVRASVGHLPLSSVPPVPFTEDAGRVKA